ncbi:hypothetical protein CC78DRAFT_95963 [Lojkania enalia]|uniref:Uncharacterized protein n=1 Tax=Lojkania enalia TaxID=147567 RepID=A0A9P4JXJ0_9PLEO|nr:hypothetical protein CC78DRAFT_95963 [Didymosphaeria enalia]
MDFRHSPKHALSSYPGAVLGMQVCGILFCARCVPFLVSHRRTVWRIACSRMKSGSDGMPMHLPRRLDEANIYCARTAEQDTLTRPFIRCRLGTAAVHFPSHASIPHHSRLGGDVRSSWHRVLFQRAGPNIPTFYPATARFSESFDAR